jgi:hypothetical protein
MKRNIIQSENKRNFDEVSRSETLKELECYIQQGFLRAGFTT